MQKGHKTQFLLLHASVDIMTRPAIVFSAHARFRMALRGIDEKSIRMIVAGGARVAEPAPAAASRRWRYAGVVGGRRIVAIVTEERDDLVVITVF
jgi:hypothetical protein